MKKSVNIITIILSVYIILFLVVYAWIFFPLLLKPTPQSTTNVPSLSISALKEASSLSSSLGKQWQEFPTEPDINNYTFGQPNPI